MGQSGIQRLLSPTPSSKAKAWAFLSDFTGGTTSLITSCIIIFTQGPL